MGWLGWTPDVCLRTDVNLLIMALQGRQGILVAMGLANPVAKPGDARMSGGDWATFKSRHNMRYSRAKAAAKKEGR